MKSDIFLEKLAGKNGGEFAELYRMNQEAIEVSKRYDRWFFPIMLLCFLIPMLFGLSMVYFLEIKSHLILLFMTVIGMLYTACFVFLYIFIRDKAYQKELDRIFGH